MTDDFESLIAQLSQAVYDRVQSELSQTPWLRAILDVRYESDGSAWLTRIRADIVDGKTVSVKLRGTINPLLISLNDHRKDLGEPWYGLLLTVDVDRRCEIRLNYDSNCAQDATFFES